MPGLLIVIDFDETLTKSHTFYQKCIAAGKWPVRFAYDRGHGILAQNCKEGLADGLRTIIQSETKLLIASNTDDKRIIVEHLRASGMTDDDIQRLYIASRPMEFSDNPYYSNDRPEDGIVSNDPRYAKFANVFIDIPSRLGGKELAVIEAIARMEDTPDELLYIDNIIDECDAILSDERIKVPSQKRFYVKAEEVPDNVDHLIYAKTYALYQAYGRDAQGAYRQRIRSCMMQNPFVLDAHGKPLHLQAIDSLYQLMLFISVEVKAQRISARCHTIKRDLCEKFQGIFKDLQGCIILAGSEGGSGRPYSFDSHSPRACFVRTFNQFMDMDAIKLQTIGDKRHVHVLQLATISNDRASLMRLEMLMDIYLKAKRTSYDTPLALGFDLMTRQLEAHLQREQIRARALAVPESHGSSAMQCLKP